MSKSIIVNIFNCFCVFYFAGNQLRENRVVDTALKAIEGGYTNLNDKLIDLDVLNGIDKIGNFFLYLCFGALVLLVILARIGIEPTGFFTKSFYQFVMILGWLSIMFWAAVDRRKKASKFRLRWLIGGTIITIVVTVFSYQVLNSPNQISSMSDVYKIFENAAILPSNVSILFLVFLVFIVCGSLIGTLYGLFTLIDSVILFFMLALVYFFRLIACFIAKMTPSGNRFGWFLFLIVIVVNFT